MNVVQLLLGLLCNTHDMSVGITLQYRLETVHLLHIVWHKGRESFIIGELELLIGNVGRIGQGFHSVFHLLPMLYASSAFALRENKGFLVSNSSGYRKLVKRSKHKPCYASQPMGFHQVVPCAIGAQ